MLQQTSSNATGGEFCISCANQLHGSSAGRYILQENLCKYNGPYLTDSMLEVVVAIDMSLAKCVDGPSLLNATAVRDWLEDSVQNALAVYETKNSTVWKIECAGCAENCVNGTSENATGEYTVTSRVVVGFPNTTVMSFAEARVGESSFPGYWAGCLDGDCNNRLLQGKDDVEGHREERSRRRKLMFEVESIPQVDTASATATKVSLADTECKCDNGEGAARDPVTGKPCPGPGGKYCSRCNTANNFFDFELDGVCKFRPSCTCNNGIPARRAADCSTRREKCVVCKHNYFLERKSLTCKSMSCPVPPPPAHSHWDLSSFLASTTAAPPSPLPRQLLASATSSFSNGSNSTASSSNGSSLSTTPSPGLIVPAWSKVRLECDGFATNMASSLRSFTAPCSHGVLKLPNPRFFQCELNFCGCPGFGEKVLGEGCPSEDGGWSCVKGCEDGWVGDTCETPAPCEVPTNLTAHLKYSRWDVCSAVMKYQTAVVAGFHPSGSFRLEQGMVEHGSLCVAHCETGYTMVRTNAPTYKSSSYEFLRCNAGVLKISSTISCVENVCPCANGEWTRGGDCRINGTTCVWGCDRGWYGRNCDIGYSCYAPGMPWPEMIGVRWNDTCSEHRWYFFSRNYHFLRWDRRE